MNNNIKAFNSFDFAANWLLIARINSIALHELDPTMSVVEQYG